MLKSFAIPGVILALMLGLAPVLMPQEAPASQNSRKIHAGAAKADAAAADPNSAVGSAISQAANPALPQSSERPTFINNTYNESIKDLWDKAAIASNFLLSLVGIVAIFVGITVVRRIGRQTLVAAEAVKAMRDQTDHMAVADRAWVLEEVSVPLDWDPYKTGSDRGMLSVQIKNHGRSVARVTELRLHAVSQVETMPPVPDYSALARLEELGEDGFILAPEQTMNLPVALGEDALETDDGGFWVYGVIEYETFGNAYVNQFCYQWRSANDPAAAMQRAGLRKGGPEAYNRVT
jgi:hypothetical protein